MSIKYKLALLISSIIMLTLIIMGLLFYNHFKSALNERVLLQLSSVQSLKRVQLEEYIIGKKQWVLRHSQFPSQFIQPPEEDVLLEFSHHHLTDSLLPDFLEADDFTKLGNDSMVFIKDISNFSPNGKAMIAIIHREGDSTWLVLKSNLVKLENILLERTGMGETGETYIVGSDYKMRSISRFYPKSRPDTIMVKTEGVINSLKNVEGKGIFPDYRGISVFSAYHQLEVAGLSWVILSEIDEKEALAPVESLKMELITTASSVLLIALIITFSLSSGITKPILRMKAKLQEMSLGKFEFLPFKKKSNHDEIDDMYQALVRLIEAINNVMEFANQVGSQNFELDFKPLSNDDVLGISLIRMRDRLLEYRRQESQFQTENQKALLQGQEDERARISKELHDGLGPLLTTLRINIQEANISIEESAKIKRLLDDIIVEVRRISNNLMPQALLDFGIGEALANLVEYLRKMTKIEINYVNTTFQNSALPSDISIGIYRIAQEAINNAIKHADATTINVSITEFDDTINLFIKDNGRGFDIEGRYTGAGLLNMKERCRLMNGDILISSNHEGTTIDIEIKKVMS